MPLGNLVRAERAWGETSDWISLMSAVLRMRRDGIILLGGLAARLVTSVCGACAVTVGPAVFLSSRGWREFNRRSDAGLVLLAHELVHIRQYREQGIFRFLSAYAGEYFVGRLRGLSHRQAYLDISFEKEARRGEAVAIRLLDGGALLRGRLTGSARVESLSSRFQRVPQHAATLG